MELYNKKIPTGDPDMPETVRLAKKIRYKIEERADAPVDVAVTDGGVPWNSSRRSLASRPAIRLLVSPHNRNSSTNDLVSPS